MAEEKEKKKKKRPTAEKRGIQNEKKQLRNQMMKSKIKTAVRQFGTKKEPAQLSAVFSLLDKALKIGLYKKNKVNRLKSKFASAAK